jgi:hypothetical protein
MVQWTISSGERPKRKRRAEELPKKALYLRANCPFRRMT